MKAYTYTADGDGKGKEGDIPANLADAAQKAHEALIEMVAEGNDALMEEFFDKGTLAAEQIVEGLKQAVREMRIFPVLCASALHNIGTRPDPQFHRRQSARAHRARRRPGHRQTARRRPARSPKTSSASAFVFKTTADPFAGRITYFKVVHRRGEERRQPAECDARRAERLAHIASPAGQDPAAGHRSARRRYRRGGQAEGHAHRRHAGGQRLANVVYPPVKLPEPSIAFAIEAKSRNDEDRMGNAVHRILEEDQSLRFYRDPQTRNSCWPARASSTSKSWSAG